MNKTINLEQTIELKINEFYFTSDLCLAAILRMNGFDLTHFKTVDEPPKARLVFYFKKKEGILELVTEYYNSSLEQHPYKKFYAELRELKNFIYNT